MDLASYTQRTVALIRSNRLPQAIIVEADRSDAFRYIQDCANAILGTEKSHTHPDFFQISPGDKSNGIRIESIRELINDVQKTPHSADRKVVVIFDGHRLNKNAAEALLKTLEEPPSDTIIFLTTPSKNFFPPTIVSRCALYRLPNNSQTKLAPYFTPWIRNLQLFLQKLPPPTEMINVPEIFSLVDQLSESMENLEKKGDPSKDSETIRDVQQYLLRAVSRAIWQIFSQKIPPHTMERLLSVIDQCSSMLAINDSFVHAIEYILFQISLVRFDPLDGKDTELPPSQIN
ncbi:MAG: hypothetical protein LBN94_01515 [Puniceicoccales bacterium]|jgi:hypothetical protein|nr:hypothetical protein [Puniceicoccales bacterium]